MEEPKVYRLYKKVQKTLPKQLEWPEIVANPGSLAGPGRVFEIPPRVLCPSLTASGSPLDLEAQCRAGQVGQANTTWDTARFLNLSDCELIARLSVPCMLFGVLLGMPMLLSNRLTLLQPLLFPLYTLCALAPPAHPSTLDSVAG